MWWRRRGGGWGVGGSKGGLSMKERQRMFVPVSSVFVEFRFYFLNVAEDLNYEDVKWFVIYVQYRRKQTVP